ncbi:hypothetical protein [Micromonospora sp. NPDC048839]|uniref:hypothetical protein n=1 Tax=Micromonospora sp. NPDC048839 TaxID=3155641 RepID=UPI0034048AE1
MTAPPLLDRRALLTATLGMVTLGLTGCAVDETPAVALAAGAPLPQAVPKGTTPVNGDKEHQKAIEFSGEAEKLNFEVRWANISGGPSAHDVRAIGGRGDQDCVGHAVDVQREARCPTQGPQQRPSGDPAGGVGSPHVEQHATANLGGGRGQCRQRHRLRRRDRQWGGNERLDELLIEPARARAVEIHLRPRQGEGEGVSAGGAASLESVRTYESSLLASPRERKLISRGCPRTVVSEERNQAWVPEACTLPSVQRPLRSAEFDDLFTTALREQQRLSPTHLRWRLDPTAEATARDLTDRESSCCSFFTFTITVDTDTLRLDVQVPAAHVDVLDGLAHRAAAGMTA